MAQIGSDGNERLYQICDKRSRKIIQVGEHSMLVKMNESIAISNTIDTQTAYIFRFINFKRI
jgi:uncharacterized membrane protein